MEGKLVFHSSIGYEAVTEYYSSHYEEIKAFVLKRISCEEDAEDIVQNVFLRILSSGKMITETTLPCLVYTVTRNLLYDYWRHRRSVDEYEHYLCKSFDTYGEMESVYSAQEMTELLEKGIARLSNTHQMIYRMNVYEGMKVSEISDKLSLKYKSVENRLGAARRNIREYMSRMLA